MKAKDLRRLGGDVQSRNRHVREINRIGKSSWLIVKGNILNYNPQRTKDGAPLNPILGCQVTPMRRFVFQVDGFTSLDAEIINHTTLRIIYNGMQLGPKKPKHHYPEDKAFASAKFSPGEEVTWEDIKEAVKCYCQYSNDRLKAPFEE